MGLGVRNDAVATQYFIPAGRVGEVGMCRHVSLIPRRLSYDDRQLNQKLHLCYYFFFF